MANLRPPIVAVSSTTREARHWNVLRALMSKKLIESRVAMEGKGALFEIVSMTVGLIRANSETRDV